MGGIFSKPKTPDPLPPPPPPTNDSAEVEAAALAERKRRAAQAGRASTILTGGQGLNDADVSTASKVLLGT